MKQIATLAVGVGLCALPAAGDGLDPILQDVLEAARADETISVLVYLTEQTDIDGLSAALDAPQFRRRDRHAAVTMALRETADRTQPDLVQHLEALQAKGAIADFQPFWITNAIRVDGPRAGIEAIASRDDVHHVFLNYRIEGVTPAEGAADQGGIAAGGPEPGVLAIRADEVWDLGITGAGALVATLDTGVDGNHPAVASRWRGLDPAYLGNPEWAFFDPVTNWTFPQDSGNHGTHTMGSVCGGLPGDQVGVAPGAEWIHAAVIDRVSIDQTVSDAILAFQWMIDPDGNPVTDFDVPDVCSNSWGLADVHGVPDCDETFWTFLDACEAAGIVMLFSAGNEGNTGLRRPADRATDDFRTVAVGAVDANNGSWPVAGFSSRGPTFCGPDGAMAIKPDIAAPGVSVRSSVPGGGYSQFNGTSMASPHVNGVVALMREANPDISVNDIKQIIYETAVDLGPTGKDNDYGYGMIDAFEAVQIALGGLSFTYDFPSGRPDWIDPNAGVTEIPITVVPSSSTPIPGSGLLHVSYDGGPFMEVPLVQNSDVSFTAVFPDGVCGADVSYYFSIEADSGQTVYSPFSAPTSTYSAVAWSGEEVAFNDDSETDTGWTVETTASDGGWNRGVPVGGGDRGDPPVDGDGSGQCWLTDNVDDNSDVDDGSTTLTSPVLDATTIDDPSISYYRWFSNTAGDAPNQDVFTIEISDDGGNAWQPLETVGPSDGESGGGWFLASHRIADHVSVTNQVRLRFIASDTDPQSVVEAGIDGLQIGAFYCDDVGCAADATGDGNVDVADMVAVISSWGPCEGCPADLSGDDQVDVADLTMVITNWGTCN